MDYKEELPPLGPIPQELQDRAKQKATDFRNAARQAYKEAQGEVVTNSGAYRPESAFEGPIDVELAPQSRFPWEVRVVVVDEVPYIRVYKGLAITGRHGPHAESRKTHLKLTSGRSTTRIRVQGGRVSSVSGKDTWLPNRNQRDPYSETPDGPGIQVSWPPTFLGGGGVIGTDPKDPEPKDGEFTYSTETELIGQNAYGGGSADPWMTFPFTAGIDVVLSARWGGFGWYEFGVFCGAAVDSEPTTINILIAHVSSADVVHQYLRSDVYVYESLPGGGTTGQVLRKKTGDDFDVEWATPEGGGGGPIDHPFKVKDVVNAEGTTTFTLIPGTANNVVVSPSGAISTPGDPPLKCYVEVTWGGTPKVVQSVDFITSSIELFSDDTVSRLLIAEILSGGAVQQYVTGSLWADRIKVAGADARYYYARI